MPCIEFDVKSLKEVEGKIFNFIWSKRNEHNSGKSIDRIKRSVLKNDYTEGGLKAPDVECLNMSLKLKQYVRAGQVKHTIKSIQQKCVEDSNNEEIFQQDYSDPDKGEAITKVAQKALNLITKYNRKKICSKGEDWPHSDQDIELVSSINVKQYLKNENKLLTLCVYNQLFSHHDNFLDLVREAETERQKKKSNILETVINSFPKGLRHIALKFNDNINNTSKKIDKIQLSDENWIQLINVTTKQLQCTLKIVMEKVSTLDVKKKNGIPEFDNNNFIKIRQHCTNTKMRSIYYRMVNNDFFSYERMHRFKMTSDNKCQRCNAIENSKHMLWECHESKKIWTLLNNILQESNLESEILTEYSDIYKITNNCAMTHIKMKIIQEMIQIHRPTGWTKKTVIDAINTIINMEKYIAKKNNTIIRWMKKWINFKNIAT